jgi:hypothetical protein
LDLRCATGQAAAVCLVLGLDAVLATAAHWNMIKILHAK